MSENFEDDVLNDGVNDSVKELAEALKNASEDGKEFEDILADEINQGQSSSNASSFKVASNLPERTSPWTKLKNALFYEVKVELSPYQQKVEDEVNEFLHQEVTWSSFKDFLFQEVPITYNGKRVF